MMYSHHSNQELLRLCDDNDSLSRVLSSRLENDENNIKYLKSIITDQEEEIECLHCDIGSLKRFKIKYEKIKLELSQIRSLLNSSYGKNINV